MDVYKRLKNRKIYCCSTKVYVSYSDIKESIKNGREVRIFEGKTTKDVTNYVLRQIIRYEDNLSNQSLINAIKGDKNATNY